MPTLANKTEILTLIQDPMFQAFLEINSHDDYLSAPEEFSDKLFEYHAGKWDEEGSGIKLFSTPRKGNNCGQNYGTWLTVSKLYGNPELAYRVQAAEYVPWGVEIDLQDVGDYRTLGEAVDAAFILHEDARIEILMTGVDESGRYGHSVGRVEIPAINQDLEHASSINQAVEQAKVQITERQAVERTQRLDIQKRMGVPVGLNDVPALINELSLRIGSSKEYQDDDTSLLLADSLNRHMFSGKGHLFSCVNNDLQKKGAEIGAGLVTGAAFVAIPSGANLEMTFINGHGVFRTIADAEASVLSYLTKVYEPEFMPLPGGPDLSFCKLDDDEYHEIYLDQNTFGPVLENPVLGQADPLDPHPAPEFVFDSLVQDVVNAYKQAREKDFQAALESAGLSF